MKTITSYLKALSFFYFFLLTNFIYSQGTCGAGYSFSVSATATTCVYNFLATYPHSASVTNVGWRVYSSGTYGKLCDVFSGNNVNRTFCFDGSYDVTCTITFTGGTYCTMTTTGINISCTGAPVCDPAPNRIAAVPDPYVEITYVGTYDCGTSDQHVSDCMYQTGCSPHTFCISCGWTYNIRIVPSTYNCEMFTYWVSWFDLIGTPGCSDTLCTTYFLTPGVDKCINAKLGQPIYIVAAGNHCCIPDGYERAYYWTPGPNCSPGTICGPTGPVGICTNNRCPTTGNCSENSVAINQTSGFPVVGCLKGGNNKLENRLIKKSVANDFIEQDLIIYNIQGQELFNGKWNFGSSSNFYLNWPNNIGPGLYIIKYKNPAEKTIKKLYKFY